MANHKRGRPKNRRAGCLLCKPHKANGVNEDTAAVRRQDLVCWTCYDEGEIVRFTLTEAGLVVSSREPCRRCNPKE